MTGKLNLEHVCDEKKVCHYYRNIDFMGDIEEGSLWELRGDVLVLVDEDEFRSLRFSEWGGCFERV